MNWLSNIQGYLDPSLKSYDKEFYTRCEQVFIQSGLSVVSALNELRDNELPCVCVIFNESLPENLKNKSNLFIQYKKPNLDLFGIEESLFDGFEVECLEDFNSVWELILDILSSEIRNLEQWFIAEKCSKSKKYFVKKNIIDFEDESEKVLIEAIEIELYLQEKFSVGEVNLMLEKNISGSSRISSVAEVLLEGNSDSTQLPPNLKYIPLDYIDSHTLFLVFDGNEKINSKISIILSEYFQNLKRIDSTTLKLQNWNQVINLVSIPIVLLDEEGQVLLYNKNFSKLNYPVQDCLKLENNQQTSINGHLFRVVINNSIEDQSTIVFFPVSEYLNTDSQLNPSSEDLGIISSSLAHELNNPLAGIMAAIDVLKLDDIDEEFIEKLDEMKNGVLRCKKLVETFLGFSRSHPENYLVQNLDTDLCSSIQQAVELIRFRLIENNISLQLSFDKKQDYKEVLNPHIVSMIFYLVFGELVTNFSHYNLVKGETSFKIDLELIEYSRKFDLILPEGVELSQGFLKSKLLIHLLETEKIILSSEDKKLRFVFK
jgi:signal transduction histidine kinase